MQNKNNIELRKIQDSLLQCEKQFIPILEKQSQSTINDNKVIIYDLIISMMDMIYGGAIKTFCSSMYESCYKEKLIVVDDFVKIKPIYEKWNAITDEKQIDEQLFEEFRTDLRALTKDNLNFFDDGSTFDSIFEHEIWNQFFKQPVSEANVLRTRLLSFIDIDNHDDNKCQVASPLESSPNYHLQKQKIPTGFQIYEDRLEVAGIHHRKDVATQFVNQTNQWVEFEGEPQNKFDKYAIKILGCYHQSNEIIKLHVGYVPSSIAEQINKFSISECKPRLLKTYLGESGYVEILIQILGPKGRIKEYGQ